MLATIIVAAAIALYAGWVIGKQYRQWKSGDFCSCGCGSCSNKQQCEKQHETQ